MGLELWFKEDIRNVLLSLNLSSSAASRWGGGEQRDAYRQGYEEAIALVAVAFGLRPADVRAADADPRRLTDARR